MGDSTDVMPRSRDDDSGQYTDSYSEDDFVEAIQGAEGLVGTGEIAETVGCTRRHALNRLRELEDAEVVRSEKVGRSLVWQLVGEAADE